MVDRVQKLHQRWVSLRSLLHSKLVTPLSTLSFPVVEERTVTRQTHTILETRLVDTNTHFRALQDAIEWCRSKLVNWQLWPPSLPPLSSYYIFLLILFILHFFIRPFFRTKYIPTIFSRPYHCTYWLGRSFICLRHASRICKRNSWVESGTLLTDTIVKLICWTIKCSSYWFVSTDTGCLTSEVHREACYCRANQNCCLAPCTRIQVETASSKIVAFVTSPLCYQAVSNG